MRVFGTWLTACVLGVSGSASALQDAGDNLAGSVTVADASGAEALALTAASAGLPRLHAIRPFQKGLMVGRKAGPQRQGSFAGSASVDSSPVMGPDAAGTPADGPSTPPAPNTPDMVPAGPETPVASSWRPVGPYGAGMGSVPAGPSSLYVLNDNNGGGVSLSWSDSSTDTNGATIQRQTLNPVSNSWGTTASFTVGPTVRSYDDFPGPGTHHYRISSANRSGSSKWSKWVTITIDAVAPVAPTGLAIAGMPPNLTWTDNANNEQGFEVQRETQLGTSWTATTTRSVPANTTSFADSPAAGVYHYRVRAFNNVGVSAYTDWAQYSVIDTVPNAPSNFVLADMGALGTQPHLTWQDNSGNETGFEVTRETQSGADWVGLWTYTLAANTVELLDSPPQATYRYRARAVNGAGPSDYTPYVTVTVGAGLPSAPNAFQAVPSADDTTTVMTWQDTSNNETGFQVQRERQSGTTWVEGTTLQAPTDAVSMNDAPGPGTFHYRIRSMGTAGASAYSAWSTLTLVQAPPGTPTSVTATDMGTRRALLSWVYDRTDVTGFDIERSPAFSTGTVSVGSTVRGYVDQSGAGTFSYHVRSTGPGGVSAYCSWVTVTVAETIPTPPSSLSVSASSPPQVRLTWADNSDNETSFKIQRATQNSDQSWATEINVGNVGANTVVFNDTAPAGNNRYRVCASNSAGDSAWTSWVETAQSGGWTALVPSADTRMVYVSSSTGNDTNSGLSQGAPVKTIARGYALLRHQYPDWLLLKCGDTWNESVPCWKLCGRSQTEPMVVSSYGTGARPMLLTAPGANAFCRQPGSTVPAQINHLWVVGLGFSPVGYNGDVQTTGIFWYGGGTNFLLEDCLIQGYQVNVAIQTDAANPLTNVTLNRNVIVDAWALNSTGHAEGVYTAYVNGLNIVGNVLDHNGYKDGVTVPNLFNHNLYIDITTANVAVRDNIVTRASSHGLQLRCGGTVDGNFFARNALAMYVAKSASNVRNNVVQEGVDISTVDTRGYGIDVYQVPMDPPTIVENNIISNKISTNKYGIGMGVGYSSELAPDLPPPGYVIIRNNIVYNWCADGFQPEGTSPTIFGKVEVRGNSFVEPNAVGTAIEHPLTTIDPLKFVYSGNTYNTTNGRPFIVNGFPLSLASWQSASGESNAITTPQSYSGPSNTAATYNGTLGGTATFDAFMVECRKQSKATWRDQYSGPALCGYIRAGFGR